MTINATTGVLSWTPTTANTGGHTIIVCITDPAGATDSDTAIIFVDQPVNTLTGVTSDKDTRILFTVTPNPVRTGRNISFYIKNIHSQSHFVLNVYDALGNKVFYKNISPCQCREKYSLCLLAKWELAGRTKKRMAQGSYLSILKSIDQHGTVTISKTMIGIKE